MGALDLTNTKEPVINFEPAWSPDGSKVLFMRQGLTSGEQDIWLAKAKATLEQTRTVKLALKLSFAPVGGIPNTQSHP